MEKILFCSVPLHFLASVNVFSDNRSFFFFSTPKPVLVRSGSQSSTLQLLFLPYYLLHLFPPLISFFLSPPPPSFIPLLKEHLWPHNKRRRGGEEEFAGLGLHLDAQKGQSCCEELLFAMSAAPCSNVPVYHHCDYVRWLGWPLHHGKLKCGPRVPLDEILALNPSYEHCVPREGFFLFLPLSLTSHFFSRSPILFKRPYSLDHSFCLLQLFFVIFASVRCGTGISKAPVSSSSTLY